MILQRRLKILMQMLPLSWLDGLYPIPGDSRYLGSFGEKLPCIFVLSTGRVGTQTLSALLGLTRGISVYHEPLPKLFCLSKTAYESCSDEVNSNLLKESFIMARQHYLFRAANNGKGYIETSPQATFLAPIINELIPHAQFIHIIRNPIEVVHSGMCRKWYDGNPYDDCRIVPGETSLIDINWGKASCFEKNVWLWTETNKWILKFTEQLPDERKILIRSEELFHGNSEVIKNLYRFANRPAPKNKKIEKILSKKLNAQVGVDCPHASYFDQEKSETVKKIADDLLGCFGYNI